MPHYFFDISDAGRSSEDEIGVELADDREARDEAIGLLSNIIRDVFPDGDQRQGAQQGGRGRLRSDVVIGWEVVAGAAMRRIGCLSVLLAEEADASA